MALSSSAPWMGSFTFTIEPPCLATKRTELDLGADNPIRCMLNSNQRVFWGSPFVG